MTKEEAFNKYIKDIEDCLKTGKCSEQSLQTPFENFINEILVDNEKIHAQPSKGEGNKPDFEVTRNKIPIGWIETKFIDVSLDRLEKDDQLRRYFETIGNVITTDYLEFRWYVKLENIEDFKNGKYIPHRTIRIAEKEGNKLKIILKDAHLKLADLFRNFTDAKVRTITKPRELARRMSETAKMIRDSIIEGLEAEHAGLLEQLKIFRETLISDLKIPLFADMYAETISYGLFSAKIKMDTKEITWQGASNQIPKTNPFLKRLFNEWTSDLPENVTKYTSMLVELMNKVNLKNVMEGFGKGTGEDPVFHFYETFLEEYNPKQKERRGVYYTPDPVVKFIVRSVDHILDKKFGLKNGFAFQKKEGGGRDLVVLDPATGTGTFLFHVLKQIFENKGYDRVEELSDTDNKKVDDDILSRLYGFELMMAPYTIAHMKLGTLLKDSGYEGDKRLNIFLTNTLEEAHKLEGTLGIGKFAQAITNESKGATRAKSELPVMVVLGNPPYSGHSANNIPWMDSLMRGKELLGDPKEKIKNRGFEKASNYFEVDGKSLGEKQVKWLYDDYVKFIRWGQWRIEKTGSGVLAFITNHGYLDNPTFRGMRQSLLESFDELYVVDLHGNAKKKETTPEGGKDENVFDIQQGVAIGIFVKYPQQPPYPPSKGGQKKIEKDPLL